MTLLSNLEKYRSRKCPSRRGREASALAVGQEVQSCTRVFLSLLAVSLSVLSRQRHPTSNQRACVSSPSARPIPVQFNISLLTLNGDSLPNGDCNRGLLAWNKSVCFFCFA